MSQKLAMQKSNRGIPKKIKNPFLRGIAFVLLLPVAVGVFAVIAFFALIIFTVESSLKILSYALLKLTIKTHKPYRFIFNGGLIIHILYEIDRNTETSKIIQILRENQQEINDRLIYSVLNLPSQVLIGRSPKMQREIACNICKMGDIFQSLAFGDNNLNTIISITAYQVGLSVFNDPKSVEWAKIHNSLGIAFQNYSYLESRELIIKSLKSEGDVVKHLAPINTKFFDFRYNKFTLGETEAKTLKAKIHLIHSEVALDFHTQALNVFTKEVFPEEWAKTMIYIGDAKLAIFNQIPNLFRKVVLMSHIAQKKNIFEDPFDAFKNQQRATLFSQEPEPDFDQMISSIFTPEIISNPRVFKEKINSFIENLVLDQKTLSAQDLVIPNWGTNYQSFYNDAITFYNMALEVTPEFSNEWVSLQISIGNYYRDCHDGDQSSNIRLAIQFYQNSLSALVEQSEYWIIAHHQIGIAYKKLGEYQNSKVHFENALSAAISQQASSKVQLIAKEFGDLSSKNQDWLCAIKNYKLAIDEVKKIRKFTTLEDRRKELSSESIPLYQSLVQAYFKDGKIEEAIQYAELSRSDQIIDLISSSCQDPDGYYSRDEILEYGLNSSQIMIDSTKQYTENMISQNPAVYEISKSFYFTETEGKDIYTAQEDIAETFKKINFQTTRRFYYESNLYNESLEQPINIEDVQKLIAFPGSAFLQFYTAEDTTYIFIIKDSSVDYHICDGVSLQDWIHDNWLLPFASPSPLNQFLWKDKINDLLASLARLIRLNELIDKLGEIEELVFLPYQYFHLIPFSALPVSEENGRHKTLGDYFAIRYVPSFRFLQLILERSCPSPEYGVDVGRYFGTVENATGDLFFSAFECESIAQMLNIPQHQRLQGNRAHRENFHRLLNKDNIQVLHLSHHALSRLDNPIESSLILYSARNDLARELLSLGHLLAPSWRMLNVSDVFLSCCETAVGNVSETDDVLSLSVGFLIAGANRVISTLWSVDDLATSLFSIMYYEERMKGLSCSTAIQSAQKRLKNFRSSQISDFPLLFDFLSVVAEQDIYTQRITELFHQEYPFSSPYWWAAFTCQGIY